jgi:DNA primase
MDATSEIKARLPIEELVGQYCQLQKKGRNFVSVCPFHNDTRPSLLVSPDKGIAYCFACQTGGDIFSFYQSIEKVDFRQAFEELAEKTGVTIEKTNHAKGAGKDEKEQMRACLKAASTFYQARLKSSESAQKYLDSRGLKPEIIKEFEIGLAPDSFSDTYQHLLKSGFSKKELLDTGLGVQKDLAEGKIYDRFRNRIMFPIKDVQGNIVGFGGRTLGESDAKYINSSEGPLYHKSNILYGLDKAKEAMRDAGSVIMVEGYFDVVACHRVGVKNVVAVSGTALTEKHAKLIKRYSEKVILCLDQDRAGRDAAERSFLILSKEGIQVNAVVLSSKDPDEVANEDPKLLEKLLTDGGVGYFDAVLEELKQTDLTSADGKREALKRILPLIESLPTSLEQEHYLAKSAGVLQTTQMTLSEDLRKFKEQQSVPSSKSETSNEKAEVDRDTFSCTEMAIGLFLCYPDFRNLMQELIVPEEGIEAALYKAIKEAPDGVPLTVEILDLPATDRERASILQLYCEHHGFMEWSESAAIREIRRSCVLANREMLVARQRRIAEQMRVARREGKQAEEAQLSTQYQQVLKLMKMAL